VASVIAPSIIVLDTEKLPAQNESPTSGEGHSFPRSAGVIPRQSSEAAMSDGSSYRQI
jgi:hypothetical protein